MEGIYETTFGGISVSEGNLETITEQILGKILKTH